jgi:hypothetical protein
MIKHLNNNLYGYESDQNKYGGAYGCKGTLAAPFPPSAASHQPLQHEFGCSIVLESTSQLSGIGQIRQSVISAASEGDLEGCRSYLSRRDIRNHDRAAIYCQLSEALYHRGSRDDALECAYCAFNLLPHGEETAHLCAIAGMALASREEL